MVKKGFLRTAEAVIAIVITFTFLMVFMQQSNVSETRRVPENILDILRDDADFRVCVETLDKSCINTSIHSLMPDSYDFMFNITEDPNEQISSGFTDRRVFANAVLLTGNSSDSTTRILRLFYWTK